MCSTITVNRHWHAGVTDCTFLRNGMHKAVVEIRDISEAKRYVFIQFARHVPLPKRIWPTLYHTMRSLDVMPCPILLVMERDQLEIHSVRILTSLQILVRVTFMTTIFKLPEKFICTMFNLSDEGSCDNARVVMFGKCKVPEALSPTYK